MALQIYLGIQTLFGFPAQSNARKAALADWNLAAP